LGKTNPFTLISQGNLARVYLAQGRRDKADPLVRDLRETAELLRERPYPPTIMTIGLVGDALLRQRDFVEAESFLRLYLDLTAKQPSDGGLHAAAESGLGACLLVQKQYDEAEPLLLRGYEGLRKHPGRIPAHLRQKTLTEALERLVQFYEETNKADEAARWRKELEAAKEAEPKP